MSRDASSVITIDSMIRQGENQVSAEIDGEVALMSIVNGKYYNMNSTGSRIWGLIDQPRRIADVCETLLEEFVIDREQCQSEVLAHVQELIQQKLVEVTRAAAA